MSDLVPANIEKEIESMRDTIMPKASEADLAIFAKFCAKTKLDPFSRQIYAINRGGRWTYQTSIDGFRVVAERSGKYEGQTPAYWCGSDGEWTDVWLKEEPPTAAKIGVYRKGHRDAVWAVARYAGYAQPNNPIWRKMPDVMLAKCAESLALRKAFPNDLSGLYSEEEMDQAAPEIQAPKENNEKALKALTEKCSDAIKAGIEREYIFKGILKREWAEVARLDVTSIVKLCKAVDDAMVEQAKVNQAAKGLANKLNVEW